MHKIGKNNLLEKIMKNEKIDLLRQAIINIENYISELEENDKKREELHDIIDTLEVFRVKDEISFEEKELKFKNDR